MSLSKLLGQLELNTCPHCSIANPVLIMLYEVQTSAHSGGEAMYWKVYKCTTCGKLVTGFSNSNIGDVIKVFPSHETVHQAIPDKPAEYLRQAIASIHAPSGAVMLAASAVDAMLKDMGYKSGKLYSRIKEAVNDCLLTSEMEKWAHEIRLDANDERHVDDEATMPTSEDADKVVSFAKALAEYLFVLPSKVQRGISKD